MYWAKQNKNGFTIAELLIVVVVIAILATITIVAYNGVSQRAKNSAAQSAASQAVKKIASEMVINNEQAPENLSSLGLRNDNNVSYQYSRDISVSPHTFCLTATTNGISYFASSSLNIPQKGVCPGHGENGAMPITNLALNPQVNNYNSLSGFRISTGRWFGGSGGSGTYSIETGTTPVGNSFGRKTWTGVPGGNTGDTGFNSGGESVVTGEVYTFSAYLRPSKAKWHEFGAGVYEPGNETSNRRDRSSTRLIPANTWTRVSWTYTIPTNVDRISTYVDITGTTSNGGEAWAIGDTLDITGFMVTKGPQLYSFADGNSLNWVWNGTPHQSTSTGSPR